MKYSILRHRIVGNMTCVKPTKVLSIPRQCNILVQSIMGYDHCGEVKGEAASLWGRCFNYSEIIKYGQRATAHLVSLAFESPDRNCSTGLQVG